MAFIEHAARPGSTLYNLGVRDVDTFFTLIQRNQHLSPSRNAVEIGVLSLQQLINQKLKRNIRSLTREQRVQMAPRLRYFMGPDFITNFLSVLPTRDTWGAAANTIDTSYSMWLNRLFQTTFREWRGDMLTSADNQSQCKAAMDIPLGTSVPDLQSSGTVQCYLCGNAIHRDPPTMECEHILPIVTALSHVWLVQRPINPYAARALQVEYAWSHECCNQIKSSYDFITYDATQNRYIPNIDVISNVLTAIDASEAYDCGPIRNATHNMDMIRQRLDPLLAVINSSITAVGDYNLYILLTKYKLLSALTNDNFISVLLGQDPNGEMIDIPVRPVYDPAARVAAKRRREEQEAEIAADFAEIDAARRAGSMRRAAKRAATEGATEGAATPEVVMEVKPRTQGGGADEDVEFPVSFFDTIQKFAKKYNFLKINGDLLPFAQLIPAYILFNPDFSPTAMEINKVCSELFPRTIRTQFPILRGIINHTNHRRLVKIGGSRKRKYKRRTRKN